MEGEVIIVAVDASKEITDYALEWTMRNVAKPTDTIILLALLPSPRRPPVSANQPHNFFSCLLKKWGIGHNKENSSGHLGIMRAVEHVVPQRINNVCVHMMQQLRSAHNVKTQVKVVADAQLGSVAAKARDLEATWVILDRRLKKEADYCLKQLNSNIVLIENTIPRILRAYNPMTIKKIHTSEDYDDKSYLLPVADMLDVLPPSTPPPPPDRNSNNRHTVSTTRSRSSLSTEKEESTSNCTDGSSPAAATTTTRSRTCNSFLHLNSQYFHDHEEEDQAIVFSPSMKYSKSQSSSLETKRKSHSGPLKSKNDLKQVNNNKATQKSPCIQAKGSTDSDIRKTKSDMKKINSVNNQSNQLNTRRESLAKSRNESLASPTSQNTIERTSSIRRAMSISIKNPPMPPPLCSICKHNAPVFGKTPRKFSYREIQIATDGFSRENFLAEGGYGSVHRGVLSDGQVVAVKQHKMLSAQGASEFISEVEILSCAQHRNLVMLVGYCIETEWLLIYEFACNGSLDKHLYGRETNDNVLAWNNRMKVAKGAARGLRYLHEDCRVGCIVHRDFRPNNILLTHDFEPMVGDFGLARWQADGQLAEETRVIGAFGYLAPEYTQTGLITEKADVYAFGVVLLELLCGIRSTDFSRNTGQQFVMEWGRPLLERKMMDEIIDSSLDKKYVEKEVVSMMYAAGLCLLPNPQQRPRMSKVLQILEGDIAMAFNAGQRATNYPKQYTNNMYGEEEETPASKTPNDGHPQNLVQEMNNMNSSPSRLSMHRNNRLNARKLEPLSPSKEHILGLDQSDHMFVTEEYQSYLQWSLAKFIGNLNGN